MPRTPRPLTLALALTGLLVFVPLAAADGAAPARAETTDADWAQQPRQVSLSTTAAGFEYQSTRATGEDLLQGRYALRTATLTHEFISTEPGNETTLRVDVEFAAIVEFRDLDSDARYGLGDQVVRRTPLADYPGATVREISSLNSDARRAEAFYPFADDPSSGPLPIGGDPGALDRGLTLSFLLPREPTQAEGEALDPTSVWLGVRIEKYPYNQTDTRLALDVRTTTTAPTTLRAQSVAAESGFFDLRYQWDRNALVDQVPMRVGTNTYDQPGGATHTVVVLLAYPRGSPVEHGTQLQVLRFEAQPVIDLVESLIKGDWRIYTAGLLATGALVAAPAWRRARRRD